MDILPSKTITNNDYNGNDKRSVKCFAIGLVIRIANEK
jgi:hypothetical protein